MNTFTHPYRRAHLWWSAICVVAILLTTAWAVRPRLARAASPGNPVWGTKPVLAYFLLTPSLAQRIPAETGLSAAQLEQAAALALQENAALQALEASIEPALADPQLSLQEKRQAVVALDHNRQVDSIVAQSSQDLTETLGEAAAQRLVSWIEKQWPIERAAHGVQSIDAPQQADGTPRSFNVYATRYDSNGVATLALPDKCLKISNGGYHSCDGDGYEVGSAYTVKVDYEGVTKRVTVGESGPWNVDDNFWAAVSDPQPRRLFGDLPVGMSEAQAAYFDNYNDGLDQYGREVTSPVAIDLSKVISQELGFTNPDWVYVTFLWTNDWPPVHEETVVTLDQPTRLHPDYLGSQCASNWLPTPGYNGQDAYLTLNAATNATSTNSAEWVADLPEAGEYKVEAFIPDHPEITWVCSGIEVPRDTAKAVYTVTHAGGKSQVTGNQGPLANQWLDLGTYNFDAGNNNEISLTDLTKEEDYTRTVSFSAVRFVLQGEPPPLPTPEPTPTPPPPPTLWLASGSAAAPATVTLPLWALNLPEGGLASARVEVSYDPAILAPVSCQADPAGVFETDSCNLDFNRDGSSPDVIEVSLSSTAGRQDEAHLALITFQIKGSPGSDSALPLAVTATQTGGSALELAVSPGEVCSQPCRNLGYLPFGAVNMLLMP